MHPPHIVVNETKRLDVASVIPPDISPVKTAAVPLSSLVWNGLIVPSRDPSVRRTF